MRIDPKNIRIFSIIAHIDHGKSTLADRIISLTGTVADRVMQDQLLDSMDLERERGITIKAQAVQCMFRAQDGITYVYYLIDTPGHVDFTYEVSRSLAACDGAILVVDAAQGIQSQTIANYYLAMENNLEILPVINKIDLPAARPDEVAKEVEDILGIDSSLAVKVSAKSGINIDLLLEQIHRVFPPPKINEGAATRGLIFDAKYDSYRGVIVYVRMVDGDLSKGTQVYMMGTGTVHEIVEVGIFTPVETKVETLQAGMVGYFCAAIKSLEDVQIGDTVTDYHNPATDALPGFKPVRQMVFCGLYPVNSDEYENLKTALEKMKLNDSAISFEPDTSSALGFGFRCGFLGLLHSDVVQERLEREFNLNLVATAPSVVYKVTLNDGTVIEVDNPSKLPEPNRYTEIQEPYVKATIYMPKDYIGAIMELCEKKRATYVDMKYLDPLRVVLTYEIPLSEMIIDFYDKLKSYTQGYASMDYDFLGYKPGKLVRMEIAIAGDPVDAFTMIVPQDFAYSRGKELVEKLKELIPRQMFEVPIQAMIGARAIARETISAMRKNVLAKCYGGDITRKKKLLEKQKKGKKRMKMIGRVEVPQEAFLAVLKLSD